MSSRSWFTVVVTAMCGKPLIALVIGTLVGFRFDVVETCFQVWEQARTMWGGLLMMLVISWISLLPVWDLVQRSMVGWRRSYAKAMLALVSVVEVSQLVLQSLFWIASSPGSTRHSSSTDSIILVVLPIYGLFAHLMIMVADKVFRTAFASPGSVVDHPERGRSQKQPCATCGYDLAGLRGDVCPECGHSVGNGTADL